MKRRNGEEEEEGREGKSAVCSSGICAIASSCRVVDGKRGWYMGTTRTNEEEERGTEKLFMDSIDGRWRDARGWK